jgi:origin recognition complex subunit 5
MGLQQLPDELLLPLAQQWPCRELQLRQLSALLSPPLPSPSTLVIYGPHATGKSAVTKAYLETRKLKHAIINCRECVTGRHLLERTVAVVHQALRSDGDEVHTGRCENISALVVHLQRQLERQDHFFLVFDGIDKQREAPPTLLPALARLGEAIRNLTTVLIVQHPAPRFLHQTGVPHIHFPAYNRNQSIHIVSQHPLDIFLEQPPEQLDYDDEVHKEDKAWLWPRYCAAIWDSLAQNAARDLVSFKEVCHKLWRPFVAPILTGEFGTRDFPRLLVNRRTLFQDEGALLDTILPAGVSVGPRNQHGHDLPYYAKWLLIAAYLASFNPARMDALYFMKATERKRRKKGGGTARSAAGRPSQNRKIPRHLLAPSAFMLDRLLSILHAILPHELRTTIDVYTQGATLTSLRLLVRGGGIGSTDPLEPGAKWRVGPAVSWEYVQSLARSLDFALLDYVAE